MSDFDVVVRFNPDEFNLVLRSVEYNKQISGIRGQCTEHKSEYQVEREKLEAFECEELLQHLERAMFHSES